jgi:hypothetical protein
VDPCTNAKLNAEAEKLGMTEWKLGRKNPLGGIIDSADVKGMDAEEKTTGLKSENEKDSEPEGETETETEIEKEKVPLLYPRFTLDSTKQPVSAD